MLYLRYFNNGISVGSGAEVELPNVAYLDDKNILFIGGDEGNAVVKYNSSRDKIEVSSFDGYDCVDLGLPSGILWAKWNVGATGETDYGLYFSWGGTTGYAYQSTAKTFGWGDYELGDGGSGPNNMTKYNSTDELMELELVDDAAHINMGGHWRMPNTAQLQELIDNTTNEWVADYNSSGKSGRLFRSISNGNTLFFPAAGFCNNGNWSNANSDGFVWSRLRDAYAPGTNCLNFKSESVSIPTQIKRSGGRSVRGIVIP